MQKTKKQLLQEIDNLRQHLDEYEQSTENGRSKPHNKTKLEQERFFKIFDNMLEGCQVISYNWRYLYVNDAVIKHSRLSKEKLLGLTMMDVYPGIENTGMFNTLRECMEKRISKSIDPEIVEAFFAVEREILEIKGKYKDN